MTKKVMNALICDRCEIKFTFTETSENDTVQLATSLGEKRFWCLKTIPVFRDAKTNETPISFGDICADCMVKLNDWWKQGRGGA